MCLGNTVVYIHVHVCMLVVGDDEGWLKSLHPRLFGRGEWKDNDIGPGSDNRSTGQGSHTSLQYITASHIVSSDSLHCALPGSRILSRCDIHITFSTAVSDLAQLLQPSYCV